MGYTLTGDQFRAANKKLGEVHRQLGQAEYPFDPDGLLIALNAIMEGRFSAVGGSFPSAALAAEYGYTIVEDVAGPADFTVKGLEFIPFLNPGEHVIDGDTMRSRAVTLNGNFGLCDAPRLLAQQADIPVKLRVKYIVLAGTKLRDRNGNLHLAYLSWNGDCWCLDFFRLDFVWGGGGRLPRCK